MVYSVEGASSPEVAAAAETHVSEDSKHNTTSKEFNDHVDSDETHWSDSSDWSISELDQMETEVDIIYGSE